MGGWGELKTCFIDFFQPLKAVQFIFKYLEKFAAELVGRN
jgi:hypothetical protein